MKDVGRTLRPLGFKGSGSLWTAVTDSGRVSIHRSNRNNWRAGEHCQGAVGFMFGLHTVPEAWWRYRNWQREQFGQEAVPIDHAEVSGPGLMDYYGLPDEPVSPTRHWSIRTDHSRGGADAEDLKFIDAHLTWAVERLARRGLELIEPARYLKELLNQSRKEVGDWEPIVVFLSEYGPSSALDEAIAGLERTSSAEFAEPVVAYARSR